MLTIGVLPETEALHWNKDTYQRLGNIIYSLCSSSPDGRQAGYQDYHDFKRHFLKDEWEDKIDELNDYRAVRGFLSVEGMVSKIGSEVVEHKRAQIGKEEPKDIPEYKGAPVVSKVVTCEKRSVSVEQLSLF